METKQCINNFHNWWVGKFLYETQHLELKCNNCSFTETITTVERLIKSSDTWGWNIPDKYNFMILMSASKERLEELKIQLQQMKNKEVENGK